MTELEQPYFVDKNDPVGRLLDAAIVSPDPAAIAAVGLVRDPPISMLSDYTLRAMHAVAAGTGGVVLEIGAYVGGRTIVLIDGASKSGTDMITIEEPVEHNHPQIPTKNSVDDLRRNVVDLSASPERHSLIPGCSFEDWVLGALHHRLLGRSITFLAWDADSHFERDFALLAPFLNPDCVVMIDDYMAGHAKSGRINRTVDALVADGILEQVAYLPWATWFGRLRHRPDAAMISKWLADWQSAAEAGDPYCDRLMSYRERLTRSTAPAVLSFEERQDFWRRASAWSEPEPEVGT